MRCWYSRWQLSNALDRGELDAAVARGHAAACATCQAYASSLRVLHARLSQGAALAPEPAEVPRRRLWLAVPIVAVGAAAAAVVLAVRSPGDSPEAPSVPVATPALDGASAIATRVTRAFTSERTPLDAELDALREEGRRGLDTALLGLRGRKP